MTKHGLGKKYEYEHWNTEYEKYILVRSPKILHNELSKLYFDVVTLQEIRFESGNKNLKYIKW
jgi:hypothetical protein